MGCQLDIPHASRAGPGDVLGLRHLPGSQDNSGRLRYDLFGRRGHRSRLNYDLQIDWGSGSYWGWIFFGSSRVCSAERDRA